MNVIPGATFESLSPEFASGLTGTVGVRIRTGAGADFLARTTSGIAADVTVGATSVYRKSLTAPTTAGQFWIVWDDGTTLSDPVELVVTYTAPTPSSGPLYVTAAELKGSLTIEGSYANDDVDLACESASRVIDAATGRRFYQDSDARFYTVSPYDRELRIDDATTITAVTVDTDGDGTYETTWVEGTDFYLDPVNAVAADRPFTNVMLKCAAGRVFPHYPSAVKVEATFGWAAIPAEVRQYARILAAQLLLRTKQAPFGILSVGETATRIGRYDPDFQRLLGHLVKTRLFV